MRQLADYKLIEKIGEGGMGAGLVVAEVGSDVGVLEIESLMEYETNGNRRQLG
jgi:hypothetical protein